MSHLNISTMVGLLVAARSYLSKVDVTSKQREDAMFPERLMTREEAVRRYRHALHSMR